MKLRYTTLLVASLSVSTLACQESGSTAEQDPAQKPAAQGIPACEDMKTTESGLQWGILEPGGEGLTPKDSDTVSVHYTGWLTDGTKFDSSRDRGEPSAFQVNGVIKGWTEGLKQMKPGMRCKFVIPSDLAYGDNGRPPKIPGGATLVFDVELLSVLRYTEVDAAKAKEVSEGPAEGVKYEVVEPGTGAMCSEGQGVALRYAFWNAQGQLLDYTERQGQKIGGTLDNLPLPFLKPLVENCKVGEVLRAAVPQSVWGRANSDTVWELELLSVNDVPKFRPLDKDKVVTTQSGLKYEVIEQGEGTAPKATDTANAWYTGWLTNGEMFDSAHARGEPMTFPLKGVIAGWTEGLQLMKPGAKFLFEIPSELAYGAAEKGSIPANSTLIFLVELVGVQ